MLSVVFRRLRQEDSKFKAYLCSIVSPQPAWAANSDPVPDCEVKAGLGI